MYEAKEDPPDPPIYTVATTSPKSIVGTTTKDVTAKRNQKAKKEQAVHTAKERTRHTKLQDIRAQRKQVEKLDSLYGTRRKPSATKKGWNLSQPKMANTDRSGLLKSEAICAPKDNTCQEDNCARYQDVKWPEVKRVKC